MLALNPFQSHIYAMRWIYLITIMLVLVAGCQTNGAGIKLAPGWTYHSITAWKAITPNKMVIAPSGEWLYVCGERSQYSSEAGLIAIRLSSAHTHVLVQGMRNANGITYAPDGSLWVGEDDKNGVIWRMVDPDHFPDDQHVDPVDLSSSHKGLMPYLAAGIFQHRSTMFSVDGRFAYMADAASDGSLYRLDIRSRSLTVFHLSRGWVGVDANDAAASAKAQGAVAFAAIHAMERLPDGTMLLAESASGRILQLHDDGKLPVVEPWLADESLMHPEDMAWDAERNWLWLVDQADTSVVRAWDGRMMHEIMSHPVSRFAGLLLAGEDIYVNIQRGPNNPSMTLRLHEKQPES